MPAALPERVGREREETREGRWEAAREAVRSVEASETTRTRRRWGG